MDVSSYLRGFGLLGTLCLVLWAAPLPAADVLLVTDNSFVSSEESARRSALQSWGHTVTTIQDSSSQATFDTAVAGVDAVYVPYTVDDWQLLYKLRSAAVGVVTEVPGLDTEFGYATSDGYTTNGHDVLDLISSIVSVGLGTGTVSVIDFSLLDPFGEPLAPNGNTAAAGFVRVADLSFGQMGYGYIEQGDALANTYSGNSTAAGRRVRLPWANTNWSRLSTEGMSMAEQSVEWAATPPLNGKTVLLVTAGAAPDSNEADRQKQFENWGYVVNTIEDSDSEAAFETALAAVDVVYLPQTVDVNEVAYKLRTTELGVVHEGVSSLDDNIGWTTSTGENANTSTTMTITDNTHPVTDGLSTGTVTIYASSSGSYGSQINGTPAAGSQTLGTNLGINSGNPNLVVIDAGGYLANSYNANNYAKGRRVHLPIGGFGTPVWSNLASDGLKIVRNALDWADEPMLIGHWKLDETSGAAAEDASKIQNHGTYVGSPTLAQSGANTTLNTAVQFNGSSQYVEMPYHDAYAATSYTVSVWINRTAAPGGFIGARNGGSDKGFDIKVETDRIHGDVPTTAGGWSSNSVDILSTETGSNGQSGETWTNRWYLVTYVIDADNSEARMYLNGDYKATAGLTDTPVVMVSGQTLRIGHTGYGSEYFAGRIDDVRLYQYCMNNDQVADLYGLVGHWKFDEGTGTTAYDSSPRLRNLSGNNSPGWGTGLRQNATELTQTARFESAAGDFGDLHGYVSAACWFNLDSDVVDLTAHTTFVECNTGSTTQTGYLLQINEGGDDLRFTIRDGATSATANTDVSHLKGGEWHHAACTYDGTELRLYVDGVLQDTHAHAGLMAADIDQMRAGTNLIGKLEDLVLYNRPMSPEEIAEHHGMIGHWNLDESSGTVATDSTLMANDGSYVGGVTLAQQGPRDDLQAATFDGVDGHVVLPEFNSDMTTGYAMAGWARFTSTGYWERIMDLGNGSGADNLLLSRQDTTSTLAGAIHHGSLGTQYVTASGGIVNGAWHHYVLSVDHTGEGKLYIDGVEASTNTIGVPGYTDRVSNFIARSNWGADAYFTGGMYDVRLYNRPLAAEEILLIYSSSSPGIRIMRWVEAR